MHFQPALLLPIGGFLHVACFLSLAESLFSSSLWWAPPLSVTSEAILNDGCRSPAFLESLVFSVRAILTLDDQGCTSHFLEWNVLFCLKKIPQKRHQSLGNSGTEFTLTRWFSNSRPVSRPCASIAVTNHSTDLFLYNVMWISRFSRASQMSSAFPRLSLATRFLAPATGYTFSSACRWLHIF